MILNVQNKYKEIEQDLINNQDFVFRLRNYYTRKYAKDSNRINNVNVGLFLDDKYNPVAQIYVQNKTGYIKSHLVFNYEGSKVKEVKFLNNSFNE